MKQTNKGRGAESVRVKDALVDAVVGQPDAEILADAKRDGIDPDEARSRVLTAFFWAQGEAAKRRNAEIGGDKVGRVPNRSKALTIDAARARAILKRVAATNAGGRIPFANAAQLGAVKDDAEALKMVATLKDLGVISEDDLD